MRHFDRGTVSAGELPDVFGAGADHAQRRQLAEVVTGRRLSMLRDESAAAHQEKTRLGERAHRELRILEWGPAHAYREIETFLDDVDAPIAGLKMEAHLRVVGHVARKDGANVAQKKADRAAQPNRSLRRRARPLDRFACGLRFADHRQTVPVERLPGVRQRDAACCAVYQMDAQLALELRNGSTQL